MRKNDLIKIRDDTYNWCMKNIRGKQIKHPQIADSIEIGRNGIKHSLWKNYSNIFYAKQNIATMGAIKNLMVLIETSNYIKFEQDNKLRNNVFGVFILENIIEFDNEEYFAQIIIKHSVASLQTKNRNADNTDLTDPH